MGSLFNFQSNFTSASTGQLPANGVSTIAVLPKGLPQGPILSIFPSQTASSGKKTGGGISSSQKGVGDVGPSGGGGRYLTLDQASRLFLSYPIAQGTETLATTNMNGILSINNNIVMTGLPGNYIQFPDGTRQTSANTGGSNPSLAPTGVVPGTYKAVSFNVNQYGQLTSATSNLFSYDSVPAPSTVPAADNKKQWSFYIPQSLSALSTTFTWTMVSTKPVTITYDGPNVKLPTTSGKAFVAYGEMVTAPFTIAGSSTTVAGYICQHIGSIGIAAFIADSYIDAQGQAYITFSTQGNGLDADSLSAATIRVQPVA